MWWKCLVHAYDLCGGMNEYVKGDGVGHYGMPIQSRLTRVDDWEVICPMKSFAWQIWMNYGSAW